jgi:hypothetical protein
VTRLQSINLIRRFSGQSLGGSSTLRLGGLWQSGFSQTHEAGPETSAASAPGSVSWRQRRVEKTFAPPHDRAKHHRGMLFSPRRTLMALGGLRDTPSYCVSLSAAGRVCNLAGKRQGSRAARDIRRGLNWRHSTLCCSHWWARQEFEVLATWSQSVARRW